MYNYSEAALRNQGPIFAKLAPFLQQVDSVLEIASGSGQHALHFTELLDHLSWQPSDLAENIAALEANIQASGSKQVAAPICLDVSDRWPQGQQPMIYTANSLHIMPWHCVEALFAALEAQLAAGGILAVYGPFKYAGEFTTPSNGEFDLWLRARDSQSGIRDFEAVQQLARTNSRLALLHDYPMPANNQLLIWQKKA